ncbi:MAG TPA: L-seryl-tRNA(Sec) selenium transferase [Dehalococcoidia bacterium]|nr:L-seryl-tRNA(Sec) selenium transferase [Dehalococcoidia bacterium]
MTNPYRSLPSVERLLADELIAPLAARHGHNAVVEIARTVLDEYRGEVERTGSAPAQPPAEAVVERAHALRRSLRRAINVTGIVIHTNLGRAPLSEAAIEAMAEAGRGYSNLEFDLESGERGSRYSHLGGLLRRITGAEAAIAVNNNASALLLALSALAQGGEVLISRGQMVEIGGGFRIPDVMRQSGATLVEVGTTNRTYTRDYAEAITERTVALLRVHSSNFRVVGFTESAPLSELGSLARERRLLLLDDIGSGALLDTRPYGMFEEPMVQDSVAAGADVVLFSGDKLVGGPQAGIAAGKSDPIEAMQRHPLARAMRMDKSSIAGLAATLEHYARGEAPETVPVWRMIAAPLDKLRRRAGKWARAAGEGAEVVAGRSMIGGGTLPGEGQESALCSIATDEGPTALAAALRANDPPIVARIERDRLLLDPRTVDPTEDRAVEAALRALCATDSTPEGAGDSTER